MTPEEQKRVEELCDELQALAEKNKAGFMLLCLKHLSTEEAFAMGHSYGKEFLQALNDSCQASGSEVGRSEVGIVDLASVNNSAAFALGLLRAFSGTRVRMAEDLSELYAESFGHA